MAKKKQLDLVYVFMQDRTCLVVRFATNADFTILYVQACIIVWRSEIKVMTGNRRVQEQAMCEFC